MGGLQWGVVIGVSLVGALCDLGVRRIPNLLTLPALLAGLGWATWVGGAMGLIDATVGCLALALPFVLLFVFAGGGAGDAKLMGAIGAWLGLLNGVIALLAVVFSGLVLAIAFALAKRQLRTALVNLARMASIAIVAVSTRSRLGGAGILAAGSRDMQTIPYGVGIFAGVCLAAGGVFAWGV